MKKLIVLIFISGIFFSMSCKKDSKITDVINFNASMKCKINGTQWSSLTRVTTLGNPTTVNGTNGNSVLNVSILGNTTGTYTLNTNAGTFQFSATYTNDSGTTDSLYTANNGTATISSIDATNKRISGTFSFQAKNTNSNQKTVTEGIFKDLEYQ